jgi:hypothetical protein
MVRTGSTILGLPDETLHRFSAANNSTTRKCVILCAVTIDARTKGRP